MSILADVTMLAIILLCVFLGFHRGFIKSFVEFIGYFVAMFAAILLSNAISVFIYNTILRDMLIKKISTAISTSAALPAEQKVQTILQALPGFVTNSMGSHGVTSASLGKAVSNSAASAAPQVADMISPVIIGLTKIIVTVLLFVLLLLAVRFLAKALNTVFKLPVLHQLNSLLGGVFGLLKGIIIVLLLCAVVQVTIPMMKEKDSRFVQQTVNSSYIFKTVYQNNPTYSLLK
jgi:uncharacterized membrane protein required for colicin V production